MRVRRILRATQDTVLSNRAFDCIERVFCRAILGRNTHTARPVFIVGPPRSGTTVLYQLLVQQFEFAYVSNAIALIPLLPGCLSVLTHGFRKPPRTLKPSRQGYVPGLWQPNEAGALMRKWFSSKRPGSPALSISVMERIYNAPFLNKNTFNSGRLPQIVKVCPQATFIHMHRDLLSNAASLCRIAGKQGNKPFGYYPSERLLRAVSAPVREAERIVCIHNEVDGITESHAVNKINVGYEDLCENTAEVLGRVEQELQSFGVDLRSRGLDVPPLSLSARGTTLSPKLRDEIQSAIEQACHIRDHRPAESSTGSWSPGRCFQASGSG